MVHGGPGTDPPGTQPENHLRSPRAGAARQLRPEPWAEFLGNGQKVRVTPLLMQQGALRIEIDRLGAEPLLVQVEPEREFDEYGRPLSAPVAGEEYARAPQTASEKAANTLAAAAWGDGTTVDEAEKKRAEQARPFGHLNDGKGLVAHSHLGQADLPRRLVPNAGEVQTPQVQQLQSKAASVQIMLTVPEAVRAIKERLGDVAPTDLYSQVKAAFPDGNVPQAWADQWNVAQAATGTHGGSVVELRRFR